jgi:O-antigen ligase
MAGLEAASRRRLLVFAASGAALSALVMLMQAAGAGIPGLSVGSADSRLLLTGLTGNPSDLAMASILLVPLLLVWGAASKKRSFYRTLAVLLALAAAVTRSLTGLAALVALLVVRLVQQRSRKLTLVTLGVGSVILVIALATGLGGRIRLGLERVRTGDWYALASARGDGWSAASEMIRERPVTGVGAANFTQLYYPSRLAWLTRHGEVGRRGELASHFEWTHCDPLQLEAELGVLGLLWMVALVVVLVRMRKRAGPLLPLAAAATVPFLVLHYPTHIAVGLVPIVLVLAELVAADTDEVANPFTWRGRRVLAALLVLLALLGAGWQVRRAALDLWMGGLEQRLLISQAADNEQRQRMAATVEAQVLARIGRLKGAAPALWRTVGRARLLRGEPRGAEAAFRTAAASWPHEDADFYLGLSLAAQGRRSEALAVLGRVCRTNPALIDLIGQPDLRQAVTDMVAVYR